MHEEGRRPSLTIGVHVIVTILAGNGNFERTAMDEICGVSCEMELRVR
jgi:hypothetical protein